MFKFLNKLSLYSILAILPLLSGCQSVDVRGQYVSDQTVAEINQRQFTKQEIAERLGNPTYVPKYSADIWYYIQRSLVKRAWFTPKVTEQRIIKIEFDSKGKAISAQLLKDSHEYINISNEYTKTHGTEQSGVQKFVGNIGRFNKSSKKKSRKSKE